MYSPKHKPFKNDPDLKAFLLTVLLYGVVLKMTFEDKECLPETNL